MGSLFYKVGLVKITLTVRLKLIYIIRDRFQIREVFL